MFDEVLHSDWSVGATKRWVASARRTPTGWLVAGPRRVGPSADLLERLRHDARSRRILAGFDFPIGLPAAYGRLTGMAGFKDALPALGRDPGWEAFYTVAAMPSEVSVARPFYPRTALKGASRSSLTAGIGVGAFADLLRACERGGPGSREACSVFWTLGSNQVGRAAASGWREIVLPAMAEGAALWPFDGDLRTLSRLAGPVLAETYPADAYAVLGAPFGRRESKRSPEDRRSKASAIMAWASEAKVDLGEASQPLLEGFGPRPSGEDPFDALAGLLAMIEVVDGRRPERTVDPPQEAATWEGWILGR